MGLLLIGVGACLLFVAGRGVDVASGTGVYRSLIEGMGGSSRTESAPAGPPDDERPNTGETGMDGLVGQEL
jgi:hypothetical protein